MEKRGPGLHGRASIDPDGQVVAGSHGSWRLSYLVGESGLSRGGSLRISTDSDTDWGIPQFHDPSATDYASVEAPPGASLQVVAQGFRSILILNAGRELAPEEVVTLVLGDRSGGSPGSQAQTFQESRRYFWVAVDPAGSGRFTRLEDSPFISIVGGQAARLVAVVPSEVAPGAPFSLLVRAEDGWGNPASAYSGDVELRAEAVELPHGRYRFTSEDRGVHLFEGCVCRAPGVHRVAVSEGQTGLATESNPLLCRERPGPHTLYWGEPHGGQLVMAEKIRDFFRYAREVAGVDFAGYQRNDHETTAEAWRLQQEAEREHHQPGRFVPLPGYEWSGSTSVGGDHNVFFRRFGQPLRRSGHEMVEDKSDLNSDLPHITDVYRAYRLADVVIVPHVGGRTADLTYHEPNLEPVIEVTSTHGTFEWFLEEAMARGYRVGFVGGSDGYTGRPGAEYPGNQERRYARGGLTALYAEALTVDGVLDALVARRCYATTGARILLQVEGDGYPMGSAYRVGGRPEITVRVVGTAPLESVELFRGMERLHRHDLGLSAHPGRVRVTWDGASRKTSYAGTIWDGSLRISGGRVGPVERLRFDSPRSYTREAGPAELRWHSVICGYRSGVVVDVEGSPETELKLALQCTMIARSDLAGPGDRPSYRIGYLPAERLAFGCRLGDLAEGPRALELGPLNRRVVVELAPERETAPREASFTFVDPDPRPGINPYWIRVVQSDMEMAWSSPLFVEWLRPD